MKRRWLTLSECEASHACCPFPLRRTNWSNAPRARGKWIHIVVRISDVCFGFLLWISGFGFLALDFGECPTVQEFLFESWDQLVELLCKISDSDSWITFLTHGLTIQGYLVWSNIDSVSDQVEVTITITLKVKVRSNNQIICHQFDCQPSRFYKKKFKRGERTKEML